LGPIIIGSLEAFETERVLGVMAARYDPDDLPVLARIVRGCVAQGL